MKKNRRRFLGSLCAAFLLPFAATSLASCQETILSFHDLQTMGFSSIKGVGLGLKDAPKTQENANTTNVQGDKRRLLALKNDGQIQEISWSNSNGEKEEIDLNLCRYSVYGKYAIIVYSDKEVNQIMSLDNSISSNEGQWHYFIYSFITGKLYYFDVDGVESFDLVESRGNRITARANGVFFDKGDGCTILDIRETNEGLIVEKRNALFNTIISDNELVNIPTIWDISISNVGNYVIAGRYLQKYDGTFRKMDYACGQLVNGDFAAINRNDDGSFSYFLIDQDLNLVPYEGELLFRYSESLAYACRKKIGAVPAFVSAEILYEDTDDVIYRKNRTNEIYHLSIGSGGVEKTECFGAKTLVSKRYLFGDRFIYLNQETNCIYEYNVKTQELEEAFVLPQNAVYGFWGYGPGGYMYLQYSVISGDYDQPVKTETETCVYLDGAFKKVPTNDSYFDYEIMPTFLDEKSDYLKDINPKTTSADSVSLLRGQKVA